MNKSEFNKLLKAEFEAFVSKYERLYNDMKAAGEDLPEYTLFIGANVRGHKSGRIFSASLTLKEQITQVKQFQKNIN